jgi:tetratricopeptide (TPR) repeat protein
MHDYDANDIKRLFSLSAPVLHALIRAGHIQPTRIGPRFRFTFDDLLLLRTVSALRAARIPARKIQGALRALRASLPPGQPMSRLSLAQVGEHLGTGDGQLALALEVTPVNAQVRRFARRKTRMPADEDAHGQFARGLELEQSDAAAARAAYEACLTDDPHYLEARINLGRLLHLAGRLSDAERVYREARDASALLSFNLAVLLEDLEREPEAIVLYNEALGHDPDLADAHFNLARLEERAGNAQASFRHLLAYRRLLHHADL